MEAEKKVVIAINYNYRSSANEKFRTENVLLEATVKNRGQAVSQGYQFFVKEFVDKFGPNNWFINKVEVTGDGNAGFWA